MNQLLNNIKTSLKESIKVATIALAITLGVTYAFASWTGPVATPPNNNVEAPINVGTVDQIKSGGLGVDTLAVYGNVGVSGYIQVGTTTSSCSSGVEGALKYVSGTGMQYCNGSSWSTLGGTGGDGSYTGSLTTGSNTGADCTNAGGVPIDIGGGDYVCKFISSSCAAGWTKYLDWTTTQTTSCTGTSNLSRLCSPTSCTTSSHVFSDNTRETCGYRDSNYQSWGGDDSGTSCTLTTQRTCTASIQEIGCY